MLPRSRPWLNTLRLGLLVSAIGWGLAFSFTFASWRAASCYFFLMGAGNVEYQPLLDYWLRMASSVFGCIGIASALACLFPRAFASFIWLLGPFHFVIGITLAVSAWNNDLTPKLHPTFIPDITFCFLAGILIQLPLLQGWGASLKALQAEKLQALIGTLEKLCQFLKLDGEEDRWLPHFQRNLDKARELLQQGWTRQDLKDLTVQIKCVFGGLGSFNDYVPGTPTPEMTAWIAANGDDNEVIGDVSRACDALLIASNNT